METSGESGGLKAKAIPSAAQKAWRFGWVATALLIAIMGVLAALSELEVFGAGFHVNFALLLGVLGTILLGVGLMALSFYSDRSGADDEAAGGVVSFDNDRTNERDEGA